MLHNEMMQNTISIVINAALQTKEDFFSPQDSYNNN